jgi:hypothetical protein
MLRLETPRSNSICNSAARAGASLSRENIAAQGDVTEVLHAVSERYDPQALAAGIHRGLAATD